MTHKFEVRQVEVRALMDAIRCLELLRGLSRKYGSLLELAFDIAVVIDGAPFEPENQDS